jgi:hypothetical protein
MLFGVFASNCSIFLFGTTINFDTPNRQVHGVLEDIERGCWRWRGKLSWSCQWSPVTMESELTGNTGLIVTGTHASQLMSNLKA